MNKIKEYTEKMFEEIKHINEYGNEYIGMLENFQRF